MKHTFKIDISKINVLKRRLLFKSFFWMLISLVVFIFPQYLKWGINNLLIFIYTTIGLVPIIFIAIYIGNNKLVRNYRTLEIIIEPRSVEFRADNMSYKIISFDNLIIEEKSNGGINLYDKNITFFTRMFDGTGYIKIPPEISDREQLIKMLNSRLVK